jgi:methionine-rich copper-binding protein CopC
LTSITIPSGVNSIGDNAFSSSGALKAVYFKGYAPSIGTGIFDNCPSDCKVYYIASKGTGYTGWGYQKTAIYDTAPALSNVTPTVLAAGSALSATSNQTGTLYLVPKATYADKTALDNASPQKTAAVTTAGIAVSIDTGGLPEGTYQVYAVNNTGYPAAVAIFGLGFQVSPASTTITIDNNVPPGLSNVTPASLKAGTALSATSNQTGTVYLVPKGSYANKAALDGASPKKTAAVPTANTAVNIDTTGLVGGIYQVYAVNSAGKLSLPSADVTIDNTAPTAAVTYSKNPVKQGDSLTITANFSKALADSPPVRIAISGVNTLAATNMTKVSNTQYTYTYTVGTGDGAANVSFSTGTDILGNTVTATPTSGVSFTVDNTAPTVTAYTPVNNAADVRLNPALTLTFSEAVTAGSGNINIYKTGGAKVETIAASQATVNDKTVTFTPVNKLSLATGYYILIDATAFKDLAGNPYAGIANNNIWSFITATAPVYITFSRPAAGVKLNINTGSTVIVKLSDNGPGIDTAKVTIQIDNGPAVKPTSLVKTGDVYTLYYVITAINYRTGDHSHTVTVTAYDLAGAAYTGSVTFTMEPKRNGFGFGRVRYD